MAIIGFSFVVIAQDFYCIPTSPILTFYITKSVTKKYKDHMRRIN